MTKQSIETQDPELSVKKPIKKTEKDTVVKQKKKKKDENAPKKGMTGFLHYSADNRLKLKAEHPEKTHKEIISLLGSTWSSMNVVQKKPYEEKALEDKVRYNKEKQAYELLKQAECKKSPAKKE